MAANMFMAPRGYQKVGKRLVPSQASLPLALARLGICFCSAVGSVVLSRPRPALGSPGFVAVVHEISSVDWSAGPFACPPDTKWLVAAGAAGAADDLGRRWQGLQSGLVYFLAVYGYLSLPPLSCGHRLAPLTHRGLFARNGSTLSPLLTTVCSPATTVRRVFIRRSRVDRTPTRRRLVGFREPWPTAACHSRTVSGSTVAPLYGVRAGTWTWRSLLRTK